MKNTSINLNRITIDVDGRPSIRHTGIPASVIVREIATGHTIDEIVAIYVQLEREDVQQALLYASHILEYAALPEPLKKATDLLGSPEAAYRWFWTPSIGLNQSRPGDMMATEEGARQVKDLLMRMEYGVYH
jgi:putative toxin-antitoxin system antitoxin component (TIGR02293 family)